MKKRNKRILLGAGLSALIVSPVGFATTSAILNKSNVVGANGESSTTNVSANKQDYVEQDDLSNLPSDQDLGVIGASYGDSTDWQRCPGSDTDIDGGTSGYLSGTIDVRTTYNYYGYIRDWPALESSQAFVRYTKNQRNKSVCNADPTSGKSYNSDTKYYCNTTRTEVHVKTWVHVWWNGVSRSVFNGEVTFTGFSTPYTTSVNLSNYGTYYFGSSSYYPSEQPTSIIQDNINSNTSYRYNSYSSVSYDSWNNKDGTAEISYYIYRAINSSGSEETLGPYHMTVKGFSTHQPTTIANGTVSASTINPLTATTDEVASALASSSLIKDYWGSKPSATDLTVSNIQNRNGNGSLTCDVVIKNYKSTNDKGNPVQTSSKFTGIKLNGFDTIPVSSLGTIRVDLSSVYADQQAYDSHPTDIKQAIVSAITGSTIPNTTYVRLDRFVSNDPKAGTITIDFTITSKWVDESNWTGHDKSFKNQIIYGFKQQQPTKWSSYANSNHDTVDLNRDFSSSAVLMKGMLIDFMKDNPDGTANTPVKVDIIKQFFLDNLSKFFDNLPSDTSSFTKDDIQITNASIVLGATIAEDLLSFNLTLNKGYGSDGRLGRISLTNNFQIYGFSTQNESNKIVEKKSPTFDKSTVTPDAVTNDDLKKLFEVQNSNKYLILPSSYRIGVDSLDALKAMLNANYCDVSGNMITDITTAFSSNQGAYRGYAQSYTTNKAIYMCLGDYNNVTFEKMGSDPFAGTLQVKVTVPQCLQVTGSTDDPTHTISALQDIFDLSGFKARTTEVVAGTVNMTTVPLYTIPNTPEGNKQIAQAIVAAGETIVKYAKGLESTDIEIVSRDDNNVEGSTSVSIKIKNGKAYENGKPQTDGKTFPSVTLTGFKKVDATIPVSHDGGIPVSGELTTKYANALTEEEILKFVFANQAQFFQGIIPEITTDESCFKVTYDPTLASVPNGEANITVKLTKYISEAGEYVDATSDPSKELSGEFVLTGFNQQGLTTTLSDAPQDFGDPDILPQQVIDKTSDAYKQLIQRIVDSANDTTNPDRVIKDLNAKNETPRKLTPADIDLEIDDYSFNNTDGSLSVGIRLLNNMAWVDGDPIDNYDFGGDLLTINGYKEVVPTTYDPKTELTANDFSVGTDGSQLGGDITTAVFTDDTNQYQYAREAIARSYASAGIFQGELPSELTADNIQIIQCAGDIAAGTVTLQFQINSYYDAGDNGREYGPGDDNWFLSNVYTVSGFFHEGLTTQLAASATLTNVNTFSPSQWVDHKDEIKTAMLAQNAITDLANNKPTSELKITDFDIAIHEQEYNDVAGTLSVDVTLNNHLYWEGGAEPEASHKFTNPIALSGFKETPATTYNSVTNPDGASDSSISSIPATDSAVTTDLLQTYIGNHKEQFFVNYPELTSSDYRVKADSITTDEANGTATFTVELLHYMDGTTGKMVEASQNTPLDGGKQFTLTGFKKDGLTTNLVLEKLSLPNVNGILASSVINDDPTIKPKLLEWIKNGLVDCPTGKDKNNLTEADFSFEVVADSANNNIPAPAGGSLRINITIKGGYAWNNTVVEDKTFNNGGLGFEIDGFKTQLETNQAQNEIQAGKFATIMANKFTAENAKELIQANLGEIFNNTAPEGATVEISGNPTPNLADASNEVNFTLSNYFDNKGKPQTGPSKPFTVTVKGFSTNYTTANKTTITGTGLENTYAVDSSVNEAFIQEKMIAAYKADTSIFTNIPDGFNPDTDIQVVTGSIKNKWNAPSEVANLGDVKFQVTLTNINTADGTGTKTFDFTMNGFKTEPNTTTILKTEFTSSTLGSKRASAMNITNAEDKKLLTDAIVDANGSSNALFGNLQPGQTTVVADDIIDLAIRPGSPNDKVGSLNVTGKLSKTKAWQNGEKADVAFEFTIKGFQSFEETKWVANTDVTITGVEDKFANDWTQAEADAYVKGHLGEFVLNPGTVKVENVTVTLKAGDIETNKAGHRIVTVTLNKYNNAEGLEVTTPPLTKDFTISGFKPFVVKETTLKTDANTILAQNVSQFWNVGNNTESLFIADIMANQATYENALLNWLKVKTNAELIFNNFDPNGYGANVTAVSLSISTTYALPTTSQLAQWNKASNIQLAITVANASGNEGQMLPTNAFTPFNLNANKTMDFVKPTPQVSIDSSNAQNEIRNIVNKPEFANSQNQDQMKDEIATVITNQIKNQFQQGNKNLPIVVTAVVNDPASGVNWTTIQEQIKTNGITINPETVSVDLGKSSALKDMNATYGITFSQIDTPIIATLKPTGGSTSGNGSVIPDGNNPNGPHILDHSSDNQWLIFVVGGLFVGLLTVLIILLVIYNKRIKASRGFDNVEGGN